MSYAPRSGRMLYNKGEYYIDVNNQIWGVLMADEETALFGPAYYDPVTDGIWTEARDMMLKSNKRLPSDNRYMLMEISKDEAKKHYSLARG